MSTVSDTASLARLLECGPAAACLARHLAGMEEQARKLVPSEAYTDLRGEWASSPPMEMISKHPASAFAVVNRATHRLMSPWFYEKVCIAPWWEYDIVKDEVFPAEHIIQQSSITGTVRKWTTLISSKVMIATPSEYYDGNVYPIEQEVLTLLSSLPRLVSLSASSRLTLWPRDSFPSPLVALTHLDVHGDPNIYTTFMSAAPNLRFVTLTFAETHLGYNPPVREVPASLTPNQNVKELSIREFRQLHEAAELDTTICPSVTRLSIYFDTFYSLLEVPHYRPSVEELQHLEQIRLAEWRECSCIVSREDNFANPINLTPPTQVWDDICGRSTTVQEIFLVFPHDKVESSELSKTHVKRLTRRDPEGEILAEGIILADPGERLLHDADTFWRHLERGKWAWSRTPETEDEI